LVAVTTVNFVFYLVAKQSTRHDYPLPSKTKDMQTVLTVLCFGVMRQTQSIRIHE